MIDFRHKKYKGAEMLPYEREKLYNWVLDSKPRNILEVGCGNGGATWPMAEALKLAKSNSKIFACDPERKLSRSLLLKYPSVVFYPVRSDEMISHILYKGIDIDFIFFDGPEDPHVAMNDIWRLEEVIPKGAYFAMHDWEFVTRGYDSGLSAKAKYIRPYMEHSKKWVEVEVLSGLEGNVDKGCFDSVGLCLYRYDK